MNKNKPAGAGGGGGGERKPDGGKNGGDCENQRLIPTVPLGLPTTRPTLTAVGHPSHTYIVQPQHQEVKNFPTAAATAKLSQRPIAPAPPSQMAQAAGRTIQVSQSNIPSIISSSLGVSGPNEGLVSLNLVNSSTTAAPSITAPPPSAVTLGQSNILPLGSTSASTGGIVHQALASTIPINMLRGAGGSNPTPVGATQPPVQAFAATAAASNFAAHIPRGTTTTLSVPKTGGVLRPGASLQIPTPGTTVNLPLVRQPILQGVRTAIPQALARSPSPVVVGGNLTQPQDLSRAGFPAHGTITPGGPPPHPMQITLNRPLLAAGPEATQATTTIPAPILQGRLGPTSQLMADPSSLTPQRISVTDSTMLHQRIAADLTPRPPLTLGGQVKANPQVIGPQPKVFTTQPLAQHVATMKSMNLAVSSPVVINSVNPSLSAATTTIASTAPIPIAKVTPQRHQIPTAATVSSLPTALPNPLLSVPAPSPLVTLAPPLTATTTATAVGGSAAVSALIQSSLASAVTPSSSTSSLSSSSVPMETSGPGRIEQGLTSAISQPGQQQGGIIISQDFQARAPGSIITMTSLAASVPGGATPTVISHPENRNEPMWYQHFTYHQPGAPTQAMTRPGASTFAFLPSQQQQGTKLQAASQLAHAMSVASSNVRYGPMVMDHLRAQPLHAGNTAFNNVATLSSAADKIANLSSRATVASSIYTASVGVQSGATGGANPGGGLSAVPLANPSSSPRPSILRKRPSEAAGVVIRKPNFNLSNQAESRQQQQHSPPPRVVDTVSSSVSSPKISVKTFSPMSENSQSSTDTALSSNDATTPTHNHNDKGKGEGEDHVENGPTSTVSVLKNIPASPCVGQAGSLSEASPRKRARKQLLHVNEEPKDNVSSSEDESAQRATTGGDQHQHHPQQNQLPQSHRGDHISKLPMVQSIMEELMPAREEFTDDDGVRWVLNKPRPTFVLIQPECINSKTKHNHFARYTDVKPKDERRPTVNELSNQKGISQKVNGWKLYFTASQLEELVDVEKDVEVQFAAIQAALSKIPTHKLAHDESGKIHEMSQANIQRCQLVQNQLTEARNSMLRTLDHKPRIQEIVHKNLSKRPIKKKERT